jgi:predicted glycosyltransferase
MSPPRFILYSPDDSTAADHLHRSLAIAAAVTEAAPDASVLLVKGETEPVGDALAPNVDLLTLPGVRSLGNGRYSARRLAMSGVELRAMRTAQIEAAVEAFRPHAMLVDTHPLGVREELRPALDALRAAGGRAALGFRDVLDDPAVVLQEWSTLNLVEAAETYFERLLVYGDRRVLDFVSEYMLPEPLADRVRHVGYVVQPTAQQGHAQPPPVLGRSSGRRPLVLATADAGEDGEHLLAAFVHAARDAAWYGMVAAGPGFSEADRHSLRRNAFEAGVEFHVSPSDVSSWFAHVDALVCTGGYGILAEAIARGTPTLCVPSVSRSREQLIRARRLGRLGLIHAVEPDSLDAGLLRIQVAALAAGPDYLSGVRVPCLDGARRTAQELLELAAR